MSNIISHNVAARVVLNFLKGLQKPEVPAVTPPSAIPSGLRFNANDMAVITKYPEAEHELRVNGAKLAKLSFKQVEALDQVFAANNDKLGEALTKLNAAQEQPTVAELLPVFKVFDDMVRNLAKADPSLYGKERQPDPLEMGGS